MLQVSYGLLLGKKFLTNPWCSLAKYQGVSHIQKDILSGHLQDLQLMFSGCRCKYKQFAKMKNRPFSQARPAALSFFFKI